jgi:dihydroorotate dehydrogenase
MVSLSLNLNVEQGRVRETARPKLGLFELPHFAAGLENPEYFNKIVRPALCKKCNNDPEEVSNLIIRTLHERERMLSLLMGSFSVFTPPENLMINVNGIRLSPFGTGVGLDTDGDALAMFGKMFGFQETGTIHVPRIEVDKRFFNMYNAQGFPSKGLDHFLANIKKYRENGGSGVVYANIVGLPGSEPQGVSRAMDDMERMITSTAKFVEGFIWSPYLPTMGGLEQLRTQKVFNETAKLMRGLAPDKLRLVRMGEYEVQDTTGVLRLVGSFLDGEGHGVVTADIHYPGEAPAMKTDMLKTPVELPERVSETLRDYERAGMEGSGLTEFRHKSVVDFRKEFRDAVIIATGGMFSGKEAYAAFSSGATMVEGKTPYEFFGPGLVRVLMDEVTKGLIAAEVVDARLEYLQRWVRNVARVRLEKGMYA